MPVERQTYLSSSSSSTILSKCRWSLCPSLASINQWQLRLFPLLWLLTDGGVGDSIRPTVALRIHPPQDTAGQIIISNTLFSEYQYQLVTCDSKCCTNRCIVALGCSSVVALCWHRWPPHGHGLGNLGRSRSEPDPLGGCLSPSPRPSQGTEGMGRTAGRLHRLRQEKYKIKNC